LLNVYNVTDKTRGHLNHIPYPRHGIQSIRAYTHTHTHKTIHWLISIIKSFGLSLSIVRIIIFWTQLRTMKKSIILLPNTNINYIIVFF